MQVDDVAATILGEDATAVCEQSVAVREDIQRELEGGCRLPLASAKRTVVATDPGVAERIAARLGPEAEVGTWRKQLGVDYALWSAPRVVSDVWAIRRLVACMVAKLAAEGRPRGSAPAVPGAEGSSSQHLAVRCGRAGSPRPLGGPGGRELLRPSTGDDCSSVASGRQVSLADHAAWSEQEVDHLASEAVRVAGLNVMGVPFHVLRLLLPAVGSPE